MKYTLLLACFCGLSFQNISSGLWECIVNYKSQQKFTQKINSRIRSTAIKTCYCSSTAASCLCFSNYCIASSLTSHTACCMCVLCTAEIAACSACLYKKYNQIISTQPTI